MSLKKKLLKGIAWDHARGIDPLKATAGEFLLKNPDITIDWEVRSLKEFGDMPVELLIDQYDLITIDHPYIGQAHENGLLVALEDYLGEEVLTELGKYSVGPSCSSYIYEGHLYAIPIDAAALVSASRSDRIATRRLPTLRSELFELYKSLPAGQSVAWPLCATDLWCSFLTLCAQDSNAGFLDDESINEVIATRVINELKLHLRFLHPESINENPVQVLDRMSEDSEIVYSPFLFGYTNYSRFGFSKHLLTFGNSPKSEYSDVSTVLGGVGLALSSSCKHLEEAVSYIKYMASNETQIYTYTTNGGQPANLQAWENEANNQLCNGFFRNTISTMEDSYVRPRHPGWNAFQEQAASLLHDGIIKNTPAEILVHKLNDMYQNVQKE